MRKSKWYLAIVVFFAVGVLGCSSTPKVTRVETSEKIDLSGQWNDTDATLVSQEMIKDCLDKPWLFAFATKSQRNPVVIVGHITNQSHEHINADVFTSSLEKELLNSGKVNFVASSDERGEVRGEREDQHKGYTDPETIQEIGKEKGADFILKGSINTVKDEIKGKYAILYQVNLELINLKTNEKVWIGQKEIKKKVENSKYSL